jgi:hypothetical protein
MEGLRQQLMQVDSQQIDAWDTAAEVADAVVQCLRLAWPVRWSNGWAYSQQRATHFCRVVGAALAAYVQVGGGICWHASRRGILFVAHFFNSPCLNPLILYYTSAIVQGNPLALLPPTNLPSASSNGCTGWLTMDAQRAPDVAP